jgi:hypothetical protein
MCIDVLGPSWGLFNIAHVFTNDKIGIEKFKFKNNETPKDSERKSERRVPFTFTFRIQTFKFGSKNW